MLGSRYASFVVLGPMFCARTVGGVSSDGPTTSIGALASAALRNERRASDGGAGAADVSPALALDGVCS